MSKIKLQIDTLRVESFDIVEASEERGTVRAHEATEQYTWCQESCAGTCYTHCWGACGDADNHGPTVSYCTQILNCI